MTPQKQTITKHDPDNGVYGDCHRAALASVLDLPIEIVPHICDGQHPPEEFIRRERAWLLTQGLIPIHVAFEDSSIEAVIRHVAAVNPGVYYLVGGTSPRGHDHTVVGINDQIAHDPHPDGGGLIGPMSDGLVWITYFGRADLTKL